MLLIVIVILASCCVGGLIGYAIGNPKGRGLEGFFLGFVFGPFGWVVETFVLPTDQVLSERALVTSERAGAATVLQAQIEQIAIERTLRACPFCAEMIRPAAILCRYCGRDVEPIEEAHGVAQTVMAELSNAPETALSRPGPRTALGSGFWR